MRSKEEIVEILRINIENMIFVLKSIFKTLPKEGIFETLSLIISYFNKVSTDSIAKLLGTPQMNIDLKNLNTKYEDEKDMKFRRTDRFNSTLTSAGVGKNS